MDPAPAPPLPGSMTVPPLFGWEVILTLLVVLIGLAVAFFLASAAGTAPDERSEWQSWLEARSRRSAEPPGRPAQTGTAPVTAGRRTTDDR
jgi:hypothetical protein